MIPSNTKEIIFERLYNKVEKTDGCWFFRGAITSQGYGYLIINYRMKQAHRVAWELENGKIPDGLYVLHKCDNPICVNPSHLFIGTQKDNILDMCKKGRSCAKLTKKQIIEIIKDDRPQRKIAKEYGVCKSEIGCIKRREVWKHIEI